MRSPTLGAVNHSNSSFKIPVSVLVVIHTIDLRVLLIERADEHGQASGFWQSVTGSLDALDEPLAQACLREVWEETGIDGTQPGCQLRDWHQENVYDIYPRWRHRYAPGIARNSEHVFGLLVPAGSPVHLSPREHVAYQWLPYQQAAGLCTSATNAQAVRMLPQFSAAPSGLSQ
jgi:dihydroneopterin triphosphate diphosphatase